jgi:AcrR family transcriptional regulator
MADRGRPTLPRSERRAAVRDALLVAVTELLSEGGSYADLSINAIVAEAGLAKSTFYQYFTGKNDLLGSLIDQVIEDTRARDAWLDFDRAPDVATVQRTIASRAAAYQPFLSLMAAAFEAAYVDAEVRANVERLMALLNDGIATHVRRGQTGGWIDPELGAEEIAVWINWMVSRGLHQLVLGADAERVDALLAGFGQLVWSILYAHAPGRS